MKGTKKVILAAALLIAGGMLVAGCRNRRADQAWFHAPEWQAGEREVDEALARGDSVVFEDPEDLFRGVEN